MPTEPMSLRDRKREDTRNRLEVAAVTLVLRDGLEHATVDSISAMADVSSRTFFNYFDTKEDAILGLREIVLSPDVVVQHIARTDGSTLVESTIRLMLDLISPSFAGASLHDQRHEVLRRHPQLFGRHVSMMSKMIDDLLAAVRQIIDHDDPAHPADPDDTTLPEMLLSLCGAAVRTTVKEWVKEGGHDPVESLEARSNALVHTLMERIR